MLIGVPQRRIIALPPPTFLLHTGQSFPLGLFRAATQALAGQSGRLPCDAACRGAFFGNPSGTRPVGRALLIPDRDAADRTGELAGILGRFSLQAVGHVPLRLEVEDLEDHLGRSDRLTHV